MYAQVQCYNPDTETWSFKSPIPFIPGKFLSAATSDGKIFIIGEFQAGD